jgi:hypothetical protein
VIGADSSEGRVDDRQRKKTEHPAHCSAIGFEPQEDRTLDRVPHWYFAIPFPSVQLLAVRKHLQKECINSEILCPLNPTHYLLLSDDEQ